MSNRVGYCDYCNSWGGAVILRDGEKRRDFHVCSVCRGSGDEGEPYGEWPEFRIDGRTYVVETLREKTDKDDK